MTNNPTKPDAQFKELISNQFFLNFLNSLHDAVVISDHNAVVKFVNKAYTRITGVSPSQIIGKKISDVRKGARLPSVLASGKPLYGIRRKERNIEYVADIDPVFSEGKVIGAIAILRDISEIEELGKKVLAYSSKVEKFKNKMMEIHRATYTLDDIIGNSEGINRVKNVVLSTKNSDVSVLIFGESGTGKELLAHAIHNISNRKNNPFVAVNSASFPENLVLSEFFGYEQGAFTGSLKNGKLGLFEIADKGTLFLDEIGDMDLELQAKILRVLETGEFYRIGGTKPIKINVRIIAATNKDLDYLIRNKMFREDLLYRLNAITIKIPPLRDRPEDIPILVQHFLKRISKKLNRETSISEDALKILEKYRFPGNARELLNILEFAANICDSDTILPHHLPIVTRANVFDYEIDLESSKEKVEKIKIVEALKKHGMSVTGKKEAAKELGISLSTLYNKIKLYRIKKEIKILN